MCGEGQSIVKVWGRGGHAKDVRGLVMELNAVAGRGEDPHTVLRRGLGEPGSQQHPIPPPQARCEQDNRRGFSSSTSQLRFAQGAEELRLVGQASWDRFGACTAAAGLAHDDRDETAVGSWGSAADGMLEPHIVGERRSAACLESAPARGGGFGAYREHVGMHQRHAPAWQQAPVQATAGEGRSGSRWGVFASDRSAQGLGRQQGPGHQAEGDPNFVTSLEGAAPARRGKKRGRHQGSPVEESEPSASSSRARGALGGDQEGLNHGAASMHHAEEGEEQHPWRQNNKSRRRERGSSSVSWRGDQVDEAPEMSRWKDSAGFREDSPGLVALEGDGCGGGVARGMFSGESYGRGSSRSGATVAGGVGARGAEASSSSSRWSKFLR
eukprot:g6629.t1